MDKITKNIINRTIEREYLSASEDFGKLLKKNEDWGKEHRKYADEIEEIQGKLQEVVPEEYKDLVEKLVDTSMCLVCAESKILFKEGVVLGATELNYLSEVGSWLNFI